MTKRKKVDPRNGAPKNSSPAPVHDGMRHSTPEGHYAGVSRTQSAKTRPFDPTSPSPADANPLIAKRLDPIAPVPGQRSRVAAPDMASRLPDQCKDEC
jgi:hypothetical protein